MVYAGQLDCYEKCNDILRQFLDLTVSTAQVYRVTDAYGEGSGKVVDASRALEPVKKDEVLYVQVDGSMVLTREDGWKEVKAGRIFTSGSCIDPNGDAGWIRHSQYTAHLGGSKEFTALMDNLLESYGRLGSRLVFISDGAVWIKNWIEDAFPEAVSILDYYHACEYLYAFAEITIKQKDAAVKWVEEQKGLLLQSRAEEVIANMQGPGRGDKEALKIIAYFQSNKGRMDYEKYRQTGAGLVGSGAIESAHRTLIQRRMKLSGQRWGLQGAQNMLNLRVIRMNGQWNKIIEMTKTDFRKAA